MFTGIIESVGTVGHCRVSGDSARLTVDVGDLADGIALGDSVAVDGACLTATRINGSAVEFDASTETLRRTTLGGLRPGGRVNLERALRVGDRLGGHFVQGHVDGVGTVAAIDDAPGQWTLQVAAPDEIIRRLVFKGSVAVAGISLTVAALEATTFSVAVIPHTLDNTTLPHASPGDRVNLELDVIGKYVERLLEQRQTGPRRDGSITPGFLAEHGFL